MSSTEMDRTNTALRQMAREEPELAARLVLQALPAAAARIPPPLDYELTVTGVGAWRIAVHDGGARVEPATREQDGGRDGLDFRLETDAAGLAEMAAGTSPLRLMVAGRVRLRGKRRRALKLRAMANGEDVSIADAAAAGVEIDPDAIYRALTYLIDPEWTRGHSFTVGYEIAAGADGAGGGAWYVTVDDGQPVRVAAERPEGGVDATVRLDFDTYKRLIGGQITPAQGMREQLTDIDGEIYPVTLLGRWIERSQGRDESELARERRQRQIQASRAGTWGGLDRNGSGNGAAAESAVTRSVPLQVEGTSGTSADGD
ncbi:MAG: SCP2 sterol-binding domain-containing protein, partial [Actinobacteria bacterium]|nr:SCP2 sterol-binding domain-containing protein [Actinomycetota bacterium]